MNMAVRLKSNLSRKAVLGIVIMAFALNPVLASAAAPGGPREMSPIAKPSKYDSKVFGADPSYEDKPYSA